MEVPPPAPDVGTPAPCGSGRVYPRHLCKLKEAGGFHLGRRSPGGVGGVMDTNANKIFKIKLKLN